MKKVIRTIVILLVLLANPVLIYYIKYTPTIANITYSDLLEDNSKNIIVDIKNANLNTKCSIDGKHWVDVKNNKCEFNVIDGSYTVKIKNNVISEDKALTVAIKEVLKVNVNTNKYYLALDETYQLRAEIESIGDVDKTLFWKSSDEEIVSVEDGLIHGLKLGSATITVSASNGISNEVEVIVTDLIRKPELDTKKPKLTCKAYTTEEAHMLDDILAVRVAAETEGTRAALLATVRFITLSFKYYVPYFFEHGRMSKDDGHRFVDGEGRYYHKGLYLSEDKYSSIKKSTGGGPKMWGCGLPNWDDEYGWPVGALYPNGFSCSGFVTWNFLNSGKDVGDIGAGIVPGVKDVSDLGEMHELTYEFANSHAYKAGDIVARDGHTALIAGYDDNYIYIAESLLRGAQINKLSYTDPNSALYRQYGYINTLDDFYDAEGAYSQMW